MYSRIVEVIRPVFAKHLAVHRAAARRSPTRRLYVCAAPLFRDWAVPYPRHSNTRKLCAPCAQSRSRRRSSRHTAVSALQSPSRRRPTAPAPSSFFSYTCWVLDRAYAVRFFILYGGGAVPVGSLRLNCDSVASRAALTPHNLGNSHTVVKSQYTVPSIPLPYTVTFTQSPHAITFQPRGLHSSHNVR